MAPPVESGRWTGRTDVDLLNARGWRIGSVEIVLEPDQVTLCHENRVLAVIRRDQFRDWLRRPSGTFRVDSVTWFTRTGLTCISIDGRHSYVVPGNCIGHLVTVI